MTVPMTNYAPFNGGVGGDVTESVWRDMMYHVRVDGVIATRQYPPETPDELEVFADSTGMQVKVKPGEAWIRGHWGEVLTQKTLPIAASDPTNDRYDLVVARVDFVDNLLELDVKTGTPSGSPVEPTVTQNTAMWEIPLARVFINNGVTAIAATDVTDRRLRVGNGLFNHFTPTLYYEGSPFGTFAKNVVNLGTGNQRWCRYFTIGKTLYIRYDFRWGTSGYDSGTVRIFTELTPGFVAPAYPTRIAAHLWTRTPQPQFGTPVDRDWFGTAMIDGSGSNPASRNLVWPFFPASGSDCRLEWYCNSPGGGLPEAPFHSGSTSYPEGGSLVMHGHLEVK